MNVTPLPIPRPGAHGILLDLFAGWIAVFVGDYREVSAREVPEPFHRLLVHHEHMTEVLEREYGEAVALSVQWSEASEATYRRRIVLRAGAAGPVVELGVVRLNLALLPEAVQREILAESTPLGRILINHRIMRRVQPHDYLRLEAASPMVRLFGLPVPDVIYGRTGTIFCNEQPAIELLEIVTGSAKG